MGMESAILVLLGMVRATVTVLPTRTVAMLARMSSPDVWLVLHTPQMKIDAMRVFLGRPVPRSNHNIHSS